jgi:hypothetical protein
MNATWKIALAFATFGIELVIESNYAIIARIVEFAIAQFV